MNVSTPGLELHAADLGDHRFNRHSHDEYSVILVTGGAKTLRVRRSEFAVRPGQIIVLPPGVSHDCEPARGTDWSFRCWYLSPELAADTLGDDSLSVNPQRLETVLEAKSLAASLVSAHARADECRDEQTDADQLGLLARTLKAASTEITEPSTEQRRTAHLRMPSYTDALREMIGGGLDLEKLGELMGVGRYQVIRDISAATAMTPGQYLNDLRLRTSKRMLADDISLAEISADLGFADQSHFSRSFKRAYGATPSAYRRSRQRVENKPMQGAYSLRR